MIDITALKAQTLNTLLTNFANDIAVEVVDEMGELVGAIYYLLDTYDLWTEGRYVFPNGTVLLQKPAAQQEPAETPSPDASNVDLLLAEALKGVKES